MAKSTIIQPQEGFQEAFVRSNVDFAVGGGSLGGGKENPLYTKVLTPNGWVKMGDLKVGMEVCTPFGKPSKILQIFEHKDRDIYRLHTKDKQAADCGIEHLWAFRTETQLQSYRKNNDVAKNIYVNTTEDLIRRLERGEALYIPNPKAVEFTHKELPIPPYVLGVLLGDGCITDSGFISTNRIYVINGESDIINKVASLCDATKITVAERGYHTYIFTPHAKEYYEYIKSVGLNVKSGDKFIPEEYLFSDEQQRRELLAGLFDCDGTVDPNGSFVFFTSSKKLKDTFMHLCRSLGIKCNYQYVYKETDNAKRGYAENYIISVQTRDSIFSSKKHQERFSNVPKKKFVHGCDHARIESIEKVGHGDTRCIYIDDPMHLYIIDDFITTHNTFAAVLSVAEPSLDGRFRGLFLRNNLGDSKAAGGVLDTFREAYGSGIEVVESGEPRVTFPSGAKIDVTHVADQTRSKILQRFKGRQYDFIYFDEGTGFTFDCFSAIYTRNRGTASWTGKVRMTTNPDRRHWLRTFLDWYIGVDGFIREDREGVVRYFYMAGETVDDVVWGDTKAEVYQKCKADIDRKLAKVNGKKGKATYESMIKSFTFYLGRMSENKAMIQNNDDYVGSVAVMGGRNSQQLLEGNWNVSPEEDENATITQTSANSVFTNDEQRNGDRWITCDLADTGTDNFLAICWDGFHIVDILIKEKTTPRQNAEALHIFAKEHDVADSHIVYDAIRGTYINDYIPDAQQFVSYRTSMGLYGRGYSNLKSECYARLIEAINRGNMSCSEDVATRVYKHQKLESNITIQAEFLEEASVVRFRELPSGKKQLYSKKEMNLYLGKGRSMDLLDPCAMRMMPVLEYPYGEELVKTSVEASRDDDDEEVVNEFNLFDETNW